MTMTWQKTGFGLFVGLAALLALPFIVYSVGFGWRGLTRDLSGETYLFGAGRTVSNGAIAAHMLLGGLLTLLVPLQLAGPLRRRARALHRWAGRVLVSFGVTTALGGLAFIVAHGTIGGAPMDVAFAAYGLSLGAAAVLTWRSARAGDMTRHRNWALRFFVLVLGSWFFRLHYTLWEIATGGLWRQPDFGGAFDLVQLVAFWVPYLVLVEIWIVRHPRVVVP